MLPAVGLEVEQPRGLEDAREGVDLEGDLVQVGDGVRHVAVLARVGVVGADANHSVAVHNLAKDGTMQLMFSSATHRALEPEMVPSAYLNRVAVFITFFACKGKA